MSFPFEDISKGIDPKMFENAVHTLAAAQSTGVGFASAGYRLHDGTLSEPSFTVLVFTGELAETLRELTTALNDHARSLIKK